MWLLNSTGMDIRGKKAVVLGTGGASLTVQTVLKDLGAEEIVVVSRSGKNNYTNIADHSDAALLVNATPVGMYPNNGECLVDLNVLPNLECVLDAVYNPAKTKLLSESEKRGIPCANGLGMLVSQAKAAAELFTGKKIDDDIIPDIIAAVERQTKNIVLVGMPGCGKTAVGRSLAKLTGRKLFDTDEIVVSRTGWSISDIFGTDGEETFREYEREALAECTKQSGTVISCGGGAVLKSENVELMRQNSYVVWLRRDVDLLPREGRPLSANADLRAMYELREPHYRMAADLTVENDSTPENAAKRIIRELGL